MEITIRLRIHGGSRVAYVRTATSVPIVGLILAGGASLRMGSDKALLTYDGCNVIDRLVAILNPFCSQVAISRPARDPVDPGIWGASVRVVRDRDDGFGGPGAGIVAAGRDFPNCDLLVVCCDQPFLTTDELERLVPRPGEERLIAAFRQQEEFCPLPSYWRQDAVLEFSRLYLCGLRGSGARIGPKSFMSQHKLAMALLDPTHSGTLMSIDTPEGYSLVSARFKG